MTNKDKTTRYSSVRGRDKRDLKNRRLKRRYGISLDDYEAMIILQDAKCAICGKTPEPNAWGTSLFIDHDHDTGRIRGLLCMRCNTLAGYVQKSRELIEKVFTYLDS